MDEVIEEDVKDEYGREVGERPKEYSRIYLTAFLCAFLACILASSQLAMFNLFTSEHGNIKTADLPLNLIRPILSETELLSMSKTLKFAETTIFSLNESDIAYNTKFRFFTSVQSKGNSRMAKWFYEGITIGIGDGNAHNLEYSSTLSSHAADELLLDLDSLPISPTKIFHRTAAEINSQFLDSGYAVYFAYTSNHSSKGTSFSPENYNNVIESMLLVARKYKQVYITLWYPHEFGASSSEDPDRYKIIAQQIIPTHTGLHSLKSTVTVWASSD